MLTPVPVPGNAIMRQHSGDKSWRVRSLCVWYLVIIPAALGIYRQLFVGRTLLLAKIPADDAFVVGAVREIPGGVNGDPSGVEL